MGKTLRGTETEQNLLKAFAGESQARNRYTYFSSAARKEGLEQVANIFIETAENEKEHAKIFFKYLEGGDVEIVAAYPAGVIGDTKTNLAAAAAGEKHEWTVLYADFARIAEKEGLGEVAAVFKSIGKVEMQHEKRYLALLKNLETGAVFARKAPAKWKCRNCGYIHEGIEAPEKCPACAHPRAYFELLVENY